MIEDSCSVAYGVTRLTFDVGIIIESYKLKMLFRDYWSEEGCEVILDKLSWIFLVFTPSLRVAGPGLKSIHARSPQSLKNGLKFHRVLIFVIIKQILHSVPCFKLIVRCTRCKNIATREQARIRLPRKFLINPIVNTNRNL